MLFWGSVLPPTFSGGMPHTPASLQARDAGFWASLLLLWEWGAVFPPLILPPGNRHAPCLPTVDHFPAEIAVFFWTFTPCFCCCRIYCSWPCCIQSPLCIHSCWDFWFSFLPNSATSSPAPASVYLLSCFSSSACISFSFLLLLNPPGICVRLPTTLWWGVALVLNLPWFLVGEWITMVHNGIIFMVLAILFLFCKPCSNYQGFPGGARGKEPTRISMQEMQETRVWSLGWEDSPGGGHGNPLQSSCPENPTDVEAWGAMVQGVAESDVTEATQHSTQHTGTMGDWVLCRTELRSCIYHFPIPLLVHTFI